MEGQHRACAPSRIPPSSLAFASSVHHHTTHGRSLPCATRDDGIDNGMEGEGGSIVTRSGYVFNRVLIPRLGTAVCRFKQRLLR